MHMMLPAITIKAALVGFEALGLDTAALLASTGLTADELADPFGAVPNEVFAQVWSAAFAQRPEPTLPTAAGFAVPFSAFGILDHLVATAATVGEGLHMLNLFLWLVSSNMTLRFTHDDGDWVWVENAPPEPARFITEQWTLALIAGRFREQIAGFGFTEVRLSLAAEGSVDPFVDLWGVPVRLGSGADGLRLADGVWQARNEAANPLLQQTLRDVAARVEIRQFEEAPLIYTIRARLPEALESGTFSVDDIAATLGLSKRTLQRRLSELDISFKELLDLYRQEQALLMLQRGERDMGSIAYDLGYSEQSSFNRAFVRWTGLAPSAWLRQQQP